MTTSFVQRGTEIIKAAVEKDNENDYDSALHLYSRGIEFLMTGMKYEKNVRINATIREKVNKYLQRAEEIKKTINKQNKSKNKQKQKQKQNKRKKNIERKTSNDDDQSDDNDEDVELDADTAKLQQGLSEAIVMEIPNVKWDDIAGLLTAKALLQETVILPVRFPHIFSGPRKPLEGILLYGPPGTGKSYLAKAVATEAKNSTFFSVSSSDLVSKYVGESQKLVRELYKMARNKKPSIIFIDEIDSLVTKRNDNEANNSRGIKTEFLVQMDGVGKSTKGVLTLGATNCPWDLDPAIRRRFKKRIYIPLPDKQARKAMFKLHVGGINKNNNNNNGGVGGVEGGDIDIDIDIDTDNDNTVEHKNENENQDNNNNNNNKHSSFAHCLNEEDFEILAERTPGFSGSDISGIVQDALMEPVRTMQSATHFKKIINGNNNDDYILVPCSPNDPKGIKMRLLDIPMKDESRVHAEPLKLSHFLRVLQSAKPTVGNEDLDRYVQWTKQYGQEG